MSQVRLRSRRRPATRDGEVQGMLAMQDLELGRTGVDSGDPAPPPTRVGRASIDVDVKPLPYRQVLAVWPDEWRERWGRRANDLEDAGLSWRDAEGRAFLELWNDWRATGSVVERN